MELRKFAACTVCVMTALAAAGCAEGTGQALTPTLPSADTTAANADGSTLKATAPTPRTPAADAEVKNLRPTLIVANAAGTQVDLALTYIFQLYEGDTILRQTDSVTTAAGATSWRVPNALLKYERTYRWRARALHNGVAGPWSDFTTFSTPEPPVVDGPVACGGSTGPEIVACVSAKYPERLVATDAGSFSLERRYANMEFLRDRVIETGKCKGLDLGLNRKRGGPEISRDFIVWRSNVGKNGRDRGVDIGSAFDDVKRKLKLTWQVFDNPPTFGSPFYKSYGSVDCSAVS